MQKEIDVLGAFKAKIRDIKDFPKPGIVFKDITPVLQYPELCNLIADEICKQVKVNNPEAVVAMDSRGYWFGMMLATRLNIPFVPVRKKGKLPYTTYSAEYDLEYGKACLEIHTDALQPNQRVLVHDDVLATGGTAEATSKLVEMCGAKVCGYSFLIELSFLEGREKLKGYSEVVHAIYTV